MRKKADLSPRKCAVAKVLLEEQHYTQTEIAHRLNISQKSVSRIKKTLDINGIYKSSRIGKCGRKKALSSRMARKLKNMTLVNRKMTSKDHQKNLEWTRSSSMQAYKKQKITPAMAKKRLEWAKGIQFTDDDWNKVQYPQDSVDGKLWKL
ncbi:hypothetical protein J6590_015378 [Homalodisca vitripennis]|nr:hypothetical protein J6590_015378 [Homalodisca vitripennis]